MKRILLTIMSIMLLASCASYVPRTENKARKVIRALDLKNRANTERIQAIANTYRLSVPVPVKEIRRVDFPAIKLPEAVPFIITKNRDVSLLVDSLVNLAKSGDKGREIESIKKKIQNTSFAAQDFEYEDEHIKARFVLDPSRDRAFSFDYMIKPRSVEKEFSYEQQVVDADRKFYQHYQFWAVVVFWLLSVVIITRPKFLFRK